MFIPYRCETCENSVYLPEDSCYDCGVNAEDDDECEENYVEMKGVKLR